MLTTGQEAFYIYILHNIPQLVDPIYRIEATLL